MEFKDRLIDLREERGLKQADIAKVLNVVPATISKYELGKSHPSPQALSMLSDFFNVSVDYLLGKTNNRTRYQDMEAQLTTERGTISLDFFFQLSPQDKELVYLLEESLSQKPEYANNNSFRRRKRK